MDTERTIDKTDSRDKAPEAALNLHNLSKEGERPACFQTENAEAVLNLPGLKAVVKGSLDQLLPRLTLETFSISRLEPDKNICNAFRPTENPKASLEATIKGESILNRLYEVAVLTPEGKTPADRFESVYGKAIADKVQSLDAKEVNRKGNLIAISLNKPLHYGDDNGAVDISKSVSFKTRLEGGGAVLDNLKGVRASKGIFEVDINRIGLQPRERGYLAALIKAGPTEAPVCALPDGSIFY